MKRRRSVTPGALGQRQVGVAAGLADGDVLQGAHQLLGERPLAVLAGARHGRLEAEPGLHRDGHLVEGVGQLQLDACCRSCPRLLSSSSGHEVGDPGDHDGEQHRQRARAAEHDEQAEHTRDHGEHELGRDQLVHRPGGGAAGGGRQAVQPRHGAPSG